MHTVDLHLAMSDDRLDDALLLEVVEALSCQRAVDLHSVDEGGDGDEAVSLHILVELVGSGLVEEDGVLGLVLDFSLGPFRWRVSLAPNSSVQSYIPLLLLLLCSSSGCLVRELTHRP